MYRRLRWAVFWALVAVFVTTVIAMFIPAVRELLVGPVFLYTSGILLLLLGAALIFLTLKGKVRGLLRAFLILTGASASGLTISAILHNVVYGLLISWFGSDFWNSIGLPDEPFFFIMAVIVCPAAFIIGAVGSIVTAIKRPQ